MARSSAEAEYRSYGFGNLLTYMAQTTFSGGKIWEGWPNGAYVCDNQAALHIASNPIFHERTKHIEVDCHFIREKIASGCITISFVNSSDKLANIFTKSL